MEAGEVVDPRKERQWKLKRARVSAVQAQLWVQGLADVLLAIERWWWEEAGVRRY